MVGEFSSFMNFFCSNFPWRDFFSTESRVNFFSLGKKFGSSMHRHEFFFWASCYVCIFFVKFSLA